MYRTLMFTCQASTFARTLNAKQKVNQVTYILLQFRRIQVFSTLLIFNASRDYLTIHMSSPRKQIEPFTSKVLQHHQRYPSHKPSSLYSQCGLLSTVKDASVLDSLRAWLVFWEISKKNIFQTIFFFPCVWFIGKLIFLKNYFSYFKETFHFIFQFFLQKQNLFSHQHFKEWKRIFFF